MNAVEAMVISTIGEPFQLKSGKWCIKVKYDCHGTEGQTEVMSDTKEGVERVSEGDIIQV